MRIHLNRGIELKICHIFTEILCSGPWVVWKSFLIFYVHMIAFVTSMIFFVLSFFSFLFVMWEHCNLWTNDLKILFYLRNQTGVIFQIIPFLWYFSSSFCQKEFLTSTISSNCGLCSRGNFLSLELLVFHQWILHVETT